MDALSKRRTRDPIPFALRLRSLGSFMLYSRETYTQPKKKKKRNFTPRKLPSSSTSSGPLRKSAGRASILRDKNGHEWCCTY